MDNFWFWADLAWNVGCAWFDTWPVWVQVLALLILAYAALWLVYAVVTGVVGLVRWAKGLRKPRITLAQKQALERIMADAQAVATAADERMAMDEVSRSVMDAFERVAAAAWYGESEESK